MNFPLFVASRIFRNEKKSFSRFITRLAIIATTLSLSVMIIATATISGFQKQISEKVFGFWGHIHIMSFDFNYNQSYENEPITKKQNFYPHIDTVAGIEQIQVFATKPGIIKTDDNIEGIVLKGVDHDYNWSFFNGYMRKGATLDISQENVSDKIVLSQKTADRLKLEVGDKVYVYFIQNPPRVRKFILEGIYSTGLDEFDKLYAIMDIRHIQRLNDWQEDQIGGFELFVSDIDDMDEVVNYIYKLLIDINLDVKTIKEINPNIFDWLRLHNINQRMIIILMTVVAVINIITVLLILILERTNMIGVLKAIGGSDWQIRKVFLYNAAYIVSMGMLFGNVLGIGLCLLQQHFNLIALSEESYYLSSVPINLNPMVIIVLNLGLFLINMLALILPSYLVTRVRPIKAIRFS